MTKHPLSLNGGMVHRQGEPNVFRLTIEDDITRNRVIEFELDGEQLMALLSGRYGQKVEADVNFYAISFLGYYPVEECTFVPADVYDKMWKEDDIKAAISAWWEDQPGSAKWDEFFIIGEMPTTAPYNKKWWIRLTQHVTKAEWDKLQDLRNQAESEADDDTGLDDE